MPLRKPEVDHAELFRAHRKTRHLQALGETSRDPSEASGPAPAAEEAPAPATREAAEAEASVVPRENPASEPVATGTEDAKAELRSDAGGPVAPSEPEPRPRSAAGDDDVRTIKLSLRYPAPGTSAALDALAAEIGEDKAVRSLLRRAFDDYRAALAAGRVPDAAPAYAETERVVTTSRRISFGAYQTAVARLDPAGLLSERAFVQLLGRRALAAFFAAERDGGARASRRGQA